MLPVKSSDPWETEVKVVLINIIIQPTSCSLVLINQTGGTVLNVSSIIRDLEESV